jgi:uncharacterized protein YndB with AHSA1/START domain
MSSDAFKFERIVKASPAEAYRAFTRSVAVREWMCDGAMVEASHRPEPGECTR